jgi:hypothetical protein
MDAAYAALLKWKIGKYINFMNDPNLATELSQRIGTNISLWIAVIGLIGVLLGSVITVIGNLLLHWLRFRPQRKLDTRRKNILNQMLRDIQFESRWRKLSTMSRIIGADKETTKRLLIEIQARGSEKEDGLWGLIEYHPLEKIEQ